MEAVAGSNGATSGGYVRYGESEFVVRGRGYCAAPRDIENTVVKAPNGTPVLVRNVADGRRGVHAAAGRGGARRGHRLGRGDDAAPARREPERRPRRRARGGRAHQPRHPATGMKIVPFYDRTRLVDTTLTTVSHNMLEGVGAGQPGAVAVPARPQRLARGRDHHAARAADGVRRASLRRRAGEPAVDGRDRLRHPARRRGHPGRERLPAPGRGAPGARARCRHVVAEPPRRWCGRRCSRCRSSWRR